MHAFPISVIAAFTLVLFSMYASLSTPPYGRLPFLSLIMLMSTTMWTRSLQSLAFLALVVLLLILTHAPTYVRSHASEFSWASPVLVPPWFLPLVLLPALTRTVLPYLIVTMPVLCFMPT